MGDGLGDVGDGGFQAARCRDVRVGGNKFAARCDLLSNIQDQPAGRFALKSKGAVSGQNLFSLRRDHPVFARTQIAPFGNKFKYIRLPRPDKGDIFW